MAAIDFGECRIVGSRNVVQVKHHGKIGQNRKIMQPGSQLHL